ncbi:MAG: asparagine synthase [Deltaproteobacteria bacterium]|nr:MAG: asparagine synthase [Deltaproteobacteria bacterium]
MRQGSVRGETAVLRFRDERGVHVRLGNKGLARLGADPAGVEPGFGRPLPEISLCSPPPDDLSKRPHASAGALSPIPSRAGVRGAILVSSGLRAAYDPGRGGGEFRRLLDASVARQLVADVDVGAFLSGGLDSSSIVAFASRHKESLKTFSFGFEESVSELPFAREVARMYGTDHMELGTGTDDLAELMTEMQDVYDEPMADSSNIPMYLISKLARRHVKVVLTGDGGDELFGGYSYWYRPLYYMNNLPPVRNWYSELFRTAAAIVRRTGIPPAPSSRYRLLGKLYRNSGCSIASTHFEQKRYLTDRQLAGILRASGTVSPAAVEMKWNGGTVDDAMRMDIEDYMPGDILVKIDRASMSNGLELRAPFLDVEFASFCIALPDSLKIDGEREKVILRESMEAAWPPSIRNRGKLGFGGPVARWLKQDAVRSLKNRYLSDPGQKIFSLISHRHTRDMVARDNYNTWALLVLAIWMDRHDFDFDEHGDAHR